MDRGFSFVEKEFFRLFSKKEMVMYHTYVTPQGNRVADRINKVLLSTSKCIVNQKKL